MRVRCVIGSLAFLLAGVFSAAALEVRLQGERLSLRADNEPLTDILRQLSRAGVAVKVDPKAEAMVTANFRNEDVQDALAVLLEKFGYVLVWDVIEGPLGPMPKLGEIQVFLPGQKKNLQPLKGTSDNFVVDRGPTGKGPKAVKDEILLGFKGGTSRDEFEKLLFQIGGTVIASIPEIGVYQIRLPPNTNVQALLEQLANNPIVARAEPNYIVDEPSPRYDQTLASAAAGAARVLDPLKDGSPVAVLDSGLLSSVNFGKLVVGYDALDPSRTITDPVGHGTQMALIASGMVSPAGTEASASSEGLPIVAIRAFDDNGQASNFSIMRSIEYALTQGAKVINLSWGTTVNSEFLATAIAYAQSKGLVVVAAAGNEPTGTAMYPAAYSGVVAVSALDSDGTLWDSSNYGDFVTVAAPGTANLPVGYDGPAGAYAGTSIASAYVSRALALYFTAHPNATRDQAISALKSAVTTSTSKGRTAQYGYGSLNPAALAKLLK